MQAGPYREASIIFKLFQPEPTRKANQKKREAGNDANPSTPTASKRSSNGSGKTVTPSASPSSSSSSNQSQGLPGKTVVVHAAPAPQKLPHPGAIFPHPNRANQFTILCCCSAYEGRTCPLPTCTFYHFPAQLNQVNRDLKQKIMEWVNKHSLVS